MTELLTGAQMRAIEAAAIEGGSMTGLELMERAGRGVVDAVFAEWPAFAKEAHAACVLCGPGNNGGDGFVVARLLRDAGWEVRVHLYGTPEKMPPDAQENHTRWVAESEVLPLSPEAVFGGARPDLIVDAVFGIGLTRPLPDDVGAVFDNTGFEIWGDWFEIRTVAVDCPSGLDLDTGRCPVPFENKDKNKLPWKNAAASADLTVTFHAPKLGHYLQLGPTLCGRLEVVDIGLANFGLARAMLGMGPDPEHARLIDPKIGDDPMPFSFWPAQCLSKPGPSGHKYNHGHVIVFAGGVGRGGAARLAARAALRCGAGLVTVVCPPAALIENACQLNAIMLRALAKDAPLTEVADHRVSAFCLGPGMGVSEQTRHRAIEILARRAEGFAHRDPAVVLDADALTSFEDRPEALFEHTHARCVLTPHEGEFARLFPDIADALRTRISKVDAARRAADRAGCIILLKGPETVIAQPGGGASVHSTGYGRAAPWLATAGAGDVLAGLIAGLAAPDTSGDLFAMTEVAAYLHVEAARSFGPGLIAEDLPEEIPKVFRGWGL